ncbi:MAG: PAS domain-containing sensor histidine kinase [Deltaproteobacteria bacterium]|nr:PAS domain-containing sensor histidine kinase [Deltaproteobacteria bacterium]
MKKQMGPETYFATPGRATKEEVEKQNSIVTSHPVVNALLNMSSGMLAILNSDRQIVAINQQLLDDLGLNSSQIMGLRLGESVQCVHANDMKAGCGTGKLCKSCPAAIAMVASLANNSTEKRKCAITVTKNGKQNDIYLSVMCSPIDIEGYKYQLLYIQDISAEQKWAAMERVLFHDINNIVAGVVSISNLLEMESEGTQKEMVTQILKSSERLSKEVDSQRTLLNSENYMYKPLWSKITLDDIATEISGLFEHHPAAKGKNLNVSTDFPSIEFVSDRAIILKILDNMLVNAFEASEIDDTIKVSLSDDEQKVRISVWNRTEIDKNVKPRIFQRNISTKDERGRGIGTYSMKFFGEDILGGKVEFKSDQNGTEFSVSVNKQPPIIENNPL